MSDDVKGGLSLLLIGLVIYWGYAQGPEQRAIKVLEKQFIRPSENLSSSKVLSLRLIRGGATSSTQYTDVHVCLRVETQHKVNGSKENANYLVSLKRDAVRQLDDNEAVSCVDENEKLDFFTRWNRWIEAMILLFR